ncbi:MAG: LacI family DNA-binding transcriptional regulator [Lachnospiraceae bacterium]|nr:LacI family DNA-binding transcriptional regulator [Lachnospiraceae bacterium]
MRPPKEVKLKDVADALGVSVVSVSNALRGRKGVSEELRTRICECAQRLGLDTEAYRAETKTAAEGQAPNHPVTIGVLVSVRYIAVGTSFYWEMYLKTANAASARGCLTALDIVEDDSDTPLPQMIRNHEVDGVIVIGPMREHYLQKLLAAADCPVVFMDEQVSDPRYSSVLSGNYYGMYRSVRELVRAGHKKIGFVGELSVSRNIIDRYYGYKKCMRENDLKIEQRWLLTDRAGDKEIPGIDLPEELPTAFACSSDFAAGILYDALCKRGLKVPKDISIASYDDYLIGHPLSGHLTTYHVDIEHMAKCAVKLVMREIRDPDAAGVMYEVDADVVRRDSVRQITKG